MLVALRPIIHSVTARVFAAAVAFFVLITAITHPVHAKDCPSASFIVGAGQAYDRAARANSAAAFSSAMSRYSDMRSIAMFALGRFRNQLPDAKAGEYVRLTQAFMGRFMQERGKGFRIGTLSVIECSGPSTNTLVKARTSGGASILFRVARAGGGFVVRDMNVQGIWLLQRMRSTFVGTLTRTNGDFNALFNFLRG
jgi:phospholipid transport system substrate-binding protein